MFDGRVILVNYRTADLVRTRVRELLASEERPAEIVVVDNDAGGGLPQGLEGLGAQTTWLAMPGNVGFAAAVNRGMQGLQRPLALWLNPDACPTPGCLHGLQHTLREHPRAAVAAPALYPTDAAAPLQPSATRRDPTWLTLLVEYGPFGRLGRRWLDAHYFLLPDPAADISPCAAVQGACFAVRQEAWERIGSLDAERFFLYWEETDFCRRARAAGWHVLFCHRLRCLHEGGASVEGGRQDAAAFWRSADAYFRLHRGARYAALARTLVAAGTAANLALGEAVRWWRPACREAKAADARLLKARWRALQSLSRGGRPCAS